MAGNLIYITDAGRAALVAPGNTGTTARQVSQIGLATAAFAFKPDMTALPNELKRITTFGGDTVAKDTIHIVIQDDSADQYKLYAFGLYLDNGVLFGVYVQNDPILEKAPASMLLLAADTVFASIDVTKLVFGPTSFLNPPATTERKGVVELATQAEVDAGADDTRAVTPKTAAARYAPLVRPQLTGPVSITSTSTDQDAQLAVAAASGALNRGAKIRFHGTFAAGTADTNARLIASIRAGYDGGTWGREFLDFLINRTPNDSNSDTNQVRAMRITHGGRVLVGNRDDDGKAALQVAGNGAFSSGVGSAGLDTGGANFRLLNGRDVLLRNDGSNFYVLLSDTSGTDAKWNNFRPLTVNVVTGAVMLDDTGVGTFVGGQLNVKGMLNVSDGTNEARMLLGPSGGYFFGTANAAGFYLPSTGAMFAFDFEKKNLLVVGKEVWNAGNLPNPAQTTGITMSGQLLAAEGTVNKPGISFVNDGAPDTGFFHIADGVFGVANNGRETMRFLAGGPSNRVLIGTAADDGANLLQVAGAAKLSGALYSAAAIIDSGAGWSTIYLKNGGKNRWTIGKSDTDDFALSAFDDDGVTQRRVLDIPRASQVASFVKRPTWAGAIPWDSMNVTPLDKNAGGQVNAPVTLYGAGDYGSQLVLNANGYAPRIQVRASTKTWMVTNGANTVANLTVAEAGTVIAHGELQAADGAVRVAVDGNLYGSLWGGWLSNFLPNNYVNRAGSTMWGRLMLARDGWDADFGLRAADGAQTFLRARRAGGIELINNAYNAVTWSLDDWGTMYMRGQQILNTDGNLFCSYRGAWMNTILDDLYNRDNGKANAGARVQWDSGVNNFGTVDRLNGALPAPWVVCGLSGPGNGTANAIVIYGVVLRNQ